MTVGYKLRTWVLDHLLSHFNAIAFCVPHVVNKKGEVFKMKIFLSNLINLMKFRFFLEKDEIKKRSLVCLLLIQLDVIIIGVISSR